MSINFEFVDVECLKPSASCGPRASCDPTVSSAPSLLSACTDTASFGEVTPG